MSLVNQVVGDTKADKLQYIALLRENANTAENVAALRELMVRLNKSDEQVHLDAALIRRADSMLANVRTGMKADRDGKALVAQAYREATPGLWDAFLAAQEQARQQWQADRAAGLEPLAGAEGLAAQAYKKAVESIDQFNQLKREHPDIFADIEFKSEADIA